jgi:hypothetical protein
VSGGRAAPSYGVLCRPGVGIAIGAGLALVLRREWRSPAALVLHWAPGASEIAPRAVTAPAARRIAARLRSQGHRAWAAGRVAFVALPDDPALAAVEAGRATAAAGRAPCVLVLAGPRPAEAEELLHLQDGILIVAPEDGDADLPAVASRGLAESGLDATVVASPFSGPARLVAAAGLAVTPAARRVLAGAVGERW